MWYDPVMQSVKSPRKIYDFHYEVTTAVCAAGFGGSALAASPFGDAEFAVYLLVGLVCGVGGFYVGYRAEEQRRARGE